MNSLIRRVCRTPGVPLAIRRQLGRMTVPYADREFVMEVGGAEYRGRLDNYIDWVVYVSGQYYEHSYLQLIRSLGLKGVALDVGANVGNHAVALAGMFRRVLAFEPFEPVFRRLERKTLHLPNVDIFNVALGNIDGNHAFAPPVGRNLGRGGLDNAGAMSVPVARGDTILRRFEGGELDDIVFVKVDVEGHELNVLEGFSGTLRDRRPVVFYEASGHSGDTRLTCLREAVDLLPSGYAFWGVGGQSTFPLQRDVARPVRIPAAGSKRRFRYILAGPEEAALPLP